MFQDDKQRAINPFQIGQDFRDDMNQTSLSLGQSLYALPAFVPQFSKGKAPVSLATYAKGREQINANMGEIQGPGGPTDDKVPAMVSDEEAILTADGVQKIKALLGDDIIKLANDKNTTPEMLMQYIDSGEDAKEVEGYADGRDAMNLSEARAQSQQFFQEPYRNPIKNPGRANPPTPAEMFQSRLEKSAPVAAEQAGILRQKMNANLAANPKPSLAMPKVTNTPVQLAKRAIGDIGLAEGLSYDVLTDPKIAQGRDDAIAGLKAKAGFAPSAVPFKSLADVPRFAAGKKDDETAYGKVVRNAVGFNVPGGLSGISKEYNSLREAGAGPGYAGISSLGQPLRAASNFIGDAASKAASATGEFFKSPAAPVSANSPIQSGQTIDNAALGSYLNRNVNAPNIGESVAESAPRPSLAAPQVSAIGKTQGWEDNGLRNDGAAQTLDWNEQRFSNSGDPVQDAALQERRAQRANMNDQRDVAASTGYQFNPNVQQYAPNQNDADRVALNRDRLAEEKRQFNGTQNAPQKFTPAFNGDDALDLPEDATQQDVARIRAMPKQAWDFLIQRLGEADESDPDNNIDSIISRFTEKAGISPNVVKYKLGFTQ